MRRSPFILAALGALAALLLASPLAARDEARKTSLTIKVKEKTLSSSGTFILDGTSTADSDSGTLTFTEADRKYGKTPEGLPFLVQTRTETLKGKRGKLVIRATNRIFLVGVVEQDDFVAIGTWSIASGTGSYTGLKGGGGVVGIQKVLTPNSHDHLYSYRYVGLVTKP